MGVFYGSNSKRVTEADINQIIYANGTILEQGTGSDGGFFVKFQFDTGGCGSTPDGYIKVELKDNIPWSKVSFEIYNSGSASCWSYNQGSYSGNLLSFNSSLDRIFNSVNCFELPQYTKTMNACDNASTNFLHSTYKTGTYNSFYITRRRDVGAGLAQITHQRSCNSAGTGSFVIIRNIFIY